MFSCALVHNVITTHHSEQLELILHILPTQGKMYSPSRSLPNYNSPPRSPSSDLPLIQAA
jgi:hypothetical protein